MLRYHFIGTIFFTFCHSPDILRLFEGIPCAYATGQAKKHEKSMSLRKQGCLCKINPPAGRHSRRYARHGSYKFIDYLSGEAGYGEILFEPDGKFLKLRYYREFISP